MFKKKELYEQLVCKTICADKTARAPLLQGEPAGLSEQRALKLIKLNFRKKELFNFACVNTVPHFSSSIH